MTLAAAAISLSGALGGALSTATAADSVCSEANTPASRLPVGTVQGTLTCLINQQRAAHGLPALAGSSRLDRVAQSWITQLVATDQFDHGNIAARFHRGGVSFSEAGEDLATGQRTIADAVSAWMASAPHCQEILNPEYRKVGTGSVGAPIRGYASGPSTWAADFSLPMNRRAPSRNWGPADHCPY